VVQMSAPRIHDVQMARRQATTLVKSRVKDRHALFQLEGLPSDVNRQVHHVGRLTSVDLEDDQE
jgi:hypothetical protein